MSPRRVGGEKKKERQKKEARAPWGWGEKKKGAFLPKVVTEDGGPEERGTRRLTLREKEKGEGKTRPPATGEKGRRNRITPPSNEKKKKKKGRVRMPSLLWKKGKRGTESAYLFSLEKSRKPKKKKKVGGRRRKEGGECPSYGTQFYDELAKGGGG